MGMKTHKVFLYHPSLLITNKYNFDVYLNTLNTEEINLILQMFTDEMLKIKVCTECVCVWGTQQKGHKDDSKWLLKIRLRDSQRL